MNEIPAGKGAAFNLNKQSLTVNKTNTECHWSCSEADRWQVWEELKVQVNACTPFNTSVDLNVSNKQNKKQTNMWSVFDKEKVENKALFWHFVFLAVGWSWAMKSSVSPRKYLTTKLWNRAFTAVGHQRAVFVLFCSRQGNWTVLLSDEAAVLTWWSLSIHIIISSFNSTALTFSPDNV